MVLLVLLPEALVSPVLAWKSGLKRTGVIAALGTSRACATATYETSVDGSESIGLFSGLNVRFCTRFMAD
jgi:hypothetical protein